MQRFTAFFRLVRWPNLVLVTLTQFIFYYCVMLPAYTDAGVLPALGWGQLGLLGLAVLFIAAAGYIINDYFDVNIDLINKPDEVIVNRFISRRWAMWWHGFLSVAGVAISVYLGIRLHFFLLPVFNLGCVLLLFVYSISLKRQLLSGNILVSLLTAWGVGVLLAIGINDDLQQQLRHHLHPELVLPPVNYARFSRIGILYVTFSFIISMIREVIKDMEDVEGDARYGCKTLPIVWGFTTAKVFVGTWLVVLIGALAILQFYVLQFHWWLSALYGFLLIMLPLLRVFQLLVPSVTPAQFHRISSLVKWIMLAGILSMFFFRYY